MDEVKRRISKIILLFLCKKERKMDEQKKICDIMEKEGD